MKQLVKILTGAMSSLLLLAGMVSCYDTVLEFDDTTVINTSDGSVSADSLSTIEEATGMIRNVQRQVISGPVHAYQNQETEYLIDFAGYMSNPHNFDGRLKSSFCFYDDFANGQMAQLQNLAPNCVPVMNSGKKLGIEPISALASILFSYSIYQCAVTYGPVPYDDFRALKSQRPLTYNKQSYVFEQLFIELIRADSILAAYKAGNDTLDIAIVQSNALTEGVEVSAQEAVSHWRKFANSMILRLAMTCVKVDGFTVNGKTVQQLAEEAVARGVLESGDRQVALMSGPDGLFAAHHPLYIVANQWVDARLHGTFHNILLRTNHPALETWFAKNNGQLTSRFNQTYPANSHIMSMRSGTYLESSGNAAYNYILYSKFNDLVFSAHPLCLFMVEEALFLRAEGALRGWNMGGTAQEFYEEGIRVSFQKNAFNALDSYMSWRGLGDNTISGKDKYLYIDYYDPDNNLYDEEAEYYYKLNNAWGGIDTNPYSTTVAGGVEEKELWLEKIITQKWIALFPMSVVAWTDIRRTGYPRMLPAVYGAYSEADGSISDDLTVRRMPFTTGGIAEAATDISTTGVPALNAESTGSVKNDMQGTRLWWDVADESNFK